MLVIILYVDELLITRSLASKIKQLYTDLKTIFEMTNLGLLHYFLGMEVFQSHGGIFLSQHMYLSSSSLRPMACQIASHSHVPWIQTQSYVMRMILPYLKISQNI